MVVYYATTAARRQTPPHPITIISQPAMQNQLTFLIPFADNILHLRESPQFVRFLIEALVVKVFTELSRPQRRVAKTPPQPITIFHSQMIDLGLPKPRSTPKHRSYRRTEKFSANMETESVQCSYPLHPPTLLTIKTQERNRIRTHSNEIEHPSPAQKPEKKNRKETEFERI